MTPIVYVALGYAALLALAAIAVAAAVIYIDIIRPGIERRRSRIRSTDSSTFVDDPFPPHRYGDPMKVIGGAGAGNTTGFFDDEESSR